MNCQVILWVSEDLTIQLECFNNLFDVDNKTVKYKDNASFLESYKDVICDYFNIKEDSNEFLNVIKNGKVIICFSDLNKYLKRVKPIYKDMKRMLNPNSMRLFINKSLKEDYSNSLINGILNKYGYMFNSQFNVSRRNYNGHKELLANVSVTNNDDRKKCAKETLLTIINEELCRDYDKTTKSTSICCYIKLRLLYDYIIRHNKNMKKPSFNSISDCKKRSETEECLFSEFLDTLSSDDFFGMGDLAYQYYEWKKDNKVYCRS